MNIRPARAAFARFMAVAGVALMALAVPAANAQQPATPRPAPAQPRGQQAAPAAAPALSTELPPKGTMVVFFDVEAVMRASSAMQNVNSQAERQRNALQADATRQEGELRKAEEELANQRNVLSADAFSQRRRDFENRVATIQQQLQTRRRNLEQNYSDTSAKVQQALTESVIEVMNEQEYQMVLPNTFIFVARSALDVSGEVARRLNRRLPTASLPN
ncbi:MAG: OmpH family outer membrane protein [Rhodospirillales bacterium]|nr:OmpH family outer membrane protein [Rhodospirillales bacterium]